MDRVDEHYEKLLAEHYTWMLGGDIEEFAARQRALLQRCGIRAGRVAVDLGCGSGSQTLALADLGFDSVVGVDTSAALLAELRAHAANRPAVRTVHADAVLALRERAPDSVDLAVCMGDTVLHLADRDVVRDFFAAAATALSPGGGLLLSYRDLSTPLTGVDRIIPVRATDDQIMTCFLDFADPDTVEVHDVVHTRVDGTWHTTKSSYPKLRLAPEWIAGELAAAGFELSRHEALPSGLWTTLAQLPTR